MKKIITLVLLVSAGFANAQAFKGKGDAKFQVGANIQNGGTGIHVSTDYGLGENMSYGFASSYLLNTTEGSASDVKFGDRFDVVYNDSTLNISTPTFDANSVIVYKNDNKVLNINSGKVVMNNVKIYDARGRLIYEQSNVNSTTAVLNDLKAEQEVLLVKITSEDNKVVTKKLVY